MLGKKKAQIWVNGKWYEWIKKDGQKGIVLNGEFKSIELIKGRWVIKDK